MKAVYQSLLHLSWIDKLLENIRIIFVDLYRDQLKKPHTSIVECDFDVYFDQQLKEVEGTTNHNTQRVVPQSTLNEFDSRSVSAHGLGNAPSPISSLLPGRPYFLGVQVSHAANFNTLR